MDIKKFEKSFKKLVTVNGNVQANEKVVIVTDYTMLDIAFGLAEVAKNSNTFC